MKIIFCDFFSREIWWCTKRKRWASAE